MRFLLLFISIQFIVQLNAQDTVRIYFEYGSAKLEFLEAQKLHDLVNNYDLESLELVEFIGYADSTGNVRSNLRLSEKRAKNAYKICKSDFNSSTEITILAKGEGTRANQNENRRVEIVLNYAQPKQKEASPEIIENIDPRCFFVDFEALEYCNLREITKGRRKYMYIEALNVGLFNERQHYFVIRNNKGDATIQRVRWKEKVTGRLWWRQTRLVALIPKASFDQFQFFTLEDAPCTGCKEEILTKDTLIMNVEKYYPDYFVLSNMQAKQRFFKENQLKIRVPKEYIDLNETYYLDYSVDARGTYGLGTVNWTTKKYGRKNQAYYFADIDLVNGRMPYIKHKRLTTVCLNQYRWNGSNWWNSMNCGTGNGFNGHVKYTATIEPGAFYHNDTLTGYLALGVNYLSRHSFRMQAGINTHASFYGAVNYQFDLFSFRIRALSIRDNWISPFELSTGKFGNRLITPYVGIDAKTSYNKSYQSFFEANLNAGISILFPIKSWIGQVYIQGGASYDFLQRINTSVYGYGQLGVRFYLPIWSIR